MKNVVILGSTGSIGTSALKVMTALKNQYRVVGLSAGQNVGFLARQIKEFRPQAVAISSIRDTVALMPVAKRYGAKILYGADGLTALAGMRGADIVLIAISGSGALEPLLKAIRSNKKIALANKEALVAAGSIVVKEARKYNAQIIPVDSEHSAIFQCLEDRPKEEINKLYLTGSGGPLRLVPKSRFAALTPEQVIRHPRWKMGKKISVDSATMMNKGLEIIEARWLFDMDPKSIEVLIHPEAIIHSMVEYVDGAVIAQLGLPDMRLPIQYALTYPHRMAAGIERVNFAKNNSLTFYKPDLRKFPCLEMAMHAASSGGDLPAVLNAANEIAVRAFLEGAIGFNRIPVVVGSVLSGHRLNINPKLDDIIRSDKSAREEAQRLCYR